MTTMAFNRQDVYKGDKVLWTEFSIHYEGLTFTLDVHDDIGRKLMVEMINRCQAYEEMK